MKKINLFLFALGVTLCVNCSFASCTPQDNPFKGKKTTHKLVCNDWMMPDSIAMSNLGVTVADILLNSTKVKVYALSPKQKITPDDIEVQPHYVIDTLLATLTSAQATALRYSLIGCGANYFNDTTNIPRVPFLPSIAYEFSSKRGTAYLFVSLTNYTWGIVYEGKTLFVYNYADGLFVNRFCEYFLSKKHTPNNK